MKLATALKLRTILDGAVASIERILNANIPPEEHMLPLLIARNGVVFIGPKHHITIDVVMGEFEITHGKQYTINGKNGQPIDWHYQTLKYLEPYIQAYLDLTNEIPNVFDLVAHTNKAMDALNNIAFKTKTHLNETRTVRAAVTDDNVIRLSTHTHTPIINIDFVCVGFDSFNSYDVLVYWRGEDNLKGFDLIQVIKDELGDLYTA